ncbi:unnamed protein product [Oppiella nova]|uniref:Uncharacterized protein n=1 Tax=Oppiella nova TaxID=334625 RepID=A0A7R9MMG5_9ACAR|nr:unnamed protein product [Oppiella nova]CAG2179891.1 unnamed protein product [Oppiella nova]
MCSMSSRIGGILAPQLIGLSSFGKSFPLLIAGLVSVMAGILVVNLPETLNRQLPETLEDIQFLKDGNKSFKLGSKQSCKQWGDKDERIKLLDDSQS